jgi:hypothetical protein
MAVVSAKVNALSRLRSVAEGFGLPDGDVLFNLPVEVARESCSYLCRFASNGIEGDKACIPPFDVLAVEGRDGHIVRAVADVRIEPAGGGSREAAVPAARAVPSGNGRR